MLWWNLQNCCLPRWLWENESGKETETADMQIYRGEGVGVGEGGRKTERQTDKEETEITAFNNGILKLVGVTIDASQQRPL